MIYDWTQDDVLVLQQLYSESGYSIHDNGESNLDEHRYEIYTDDGRGNGDFVCTTSDLFWIRRIAQALDSQKY